MLVQQSLKVRKILPGANKSLMNVVLFLQENVF